MTLYKLLFHETSYFKKHENEEMNSKKSQNEWNENLGQANKKIESG